MRCANCNIFVNVVHKWEQTYELSLGIHTAGILALDIAITSCVIAAQLSNYSKLCDNILLPRLRCPAYWPWCLCEHAVN